MKEKLGDPLLIPIYIGAAIIIVATAFLLKRVRTEAGRVLDTLDRLSAPVSEGPELTREQQAAGLSLQAWEEMRASVELLPEGPHGELWKPLEQTVERYTSPEECEGYFVTRPVRETLSLERVLSLHYHSGWYAVVPGILTGFGLLLTFTALLLALLEVNYDKSNPSEPFKGIDHLINDLSLKFISSVVALLCSIVFTLTERQTSVRLRSAFDSFVRLIESRIPYLSPARVLLDIQRFAGKQSVSISNISSDVVDRFVGAFRDEVSPGLAQGVSVGMAEQLQQEFRPTMLEMSATLEELRRAVLALEGQKQDSVTAEIRTVLGSLQSSLVDALGAMGQQFHTALSGAATTEFDRVQGTMESTRQMLAHMNEQFATMQTAFAGVVAKAEESTTNQIEIGREQTQALAMLMNGLMTRLQETADHNVSSVREQLTLVVTDLSQKVGALSSELMTAAHETAAQSRQTAQDVIQQTGHWSKATAQRLEQLVAGIEARSNDFQQAGKTLLSLHEAFTATIAQNGNALKTMHSAAETVERYTKNLEGHAAAVGKVQGQQEQTAKALRDVSATFRSSIEQNDVLLKRYEGVFASYKGAFDQMDSRIAATFKHINTGMEQYNRAVEGNFKAIVNTTNETLPHIADVLSAQTQELEQHLEELNGLLGKGLERLSARAR